MVWIVLEEGAALVPKACPAPTSSRDEICKSFTSLAIAALLVLAAVVALPFR